MGIVWLGWGCQGPAADTSEDPGAVLPDGGRQTLVSLPTLDGQQMQILLENWVDRECGRRLLTQLKRRLRGKRRVGKQAASSRTVGLPPLTPWLPQAGLL